MDHHNTMVHISEVTPVIAGLIQSGTLTRRSSLDQFCPWCAKFLMKHDYNCPHCGLAL